MITHPQAKRFSNENARPLASHMGQLYRTFAQFQLNIVRDFEALTTEDLDADLIADGSPENGNNAISKGDVAALKYVVEQIKAAFEVEDRLAVINRWASNTKPLY